MSQQAQQTGATAPDSPVMVVTSNVQKYAIKKKKVLSAEESELFELTQAAGITVDQEVFKIIADLLKMNVAPQAVFQTLKAMCAGLRVPESSAESSHTASTTAAPPEVKEEESLVSGKSPKPAAAHHSASAPRSARVNTKIAVYGPQDASSAHSQVRNKPGASQSEKSRENSSQKVQRQPSATRGQKTKSSGSSSSSSQINSS
ncbi:mitotic-spindle organizing protein 2 isoform X1 [Gambusia affinis]|uniref:mitotic-spindle organizing protein 2 isoform X1 n=1 Tax=Gambusia affinis TaxID=33528 RepID=UPI001CDB855A|nr:mitotic-spindle organizing protein 2 isoform X1 [Gambusia affinis]XP_044000400.1 mitotic-spindle organizing protein 2 isoform X1 [Gambusia affinis]XP_044000401.1 mitotic-spindle organizing protein 2 isoform X1 [Gambusia affinis]